MSSPYVYSPHTYYPTPYVEQYYNQPQQHSPFIPPAHLYPSSPYHPSSPLPDPTTPNTPRRVHFDDELWNNPPPRQRRPSWHAPASAPMFTPPAIPSTPYAPFLGVPEGHNRRHSFGNSPFSTPWSGWGTPLPPAAPWMQPFQTPPFLIHPYLNGEAPRRDFLFDLSSPVFSPLKVIGPGGQTTFLTTEESRQPATHPPVTRMRITCDAIPQWPIELAWNFRNYGSQVHAVDPQTPISLGDVLIAIHRSLQKQISHIDWGRLSVSEEEAIARAYTRRCRSLPSMSHVESSQGVRRVDFLLDKFMFRGLVRTAGEQGWENLKLIV